MNLKWLFALLALVVAALLALVLLRPASMPGFVLPDAADTGNDRARRTPPPGSAMDAVGADDPALDEIALDPEAIASLAAAREFGDPRTPPIERSAPQEQASAEELADPALYAEYEARQELKLKRAYVVEAEKYVAQLRADIERGKAGGIPPEEIAKAEQKVKGIEEMRAKLLAENPGLLTSGNGSADGSAPHGSTAP